MEDELYNYSSDFRGMLDNIYNTTYPRDGEIYTVPTGIIVLLACMYGAISLVAVIGNGLVILVIVKDKRMQTVTNIFIANLALADVIIGMFSTPFQLQPALHQRWDFPEFLCHIAPSFKVLSVSVSVLTLTVISIDRYVAVIYPLRAGFSRRYAAIGLILIWVVGICSSFPAGFYRKVVKEPDFNSPEGWKPYCAVKWPNPYFGTYYLFYLLSVQYLCPLLVINFSYARIACRIWGTKAPGNTIDRDNVRQRNKRKVVKMLIIVVLLFVICWMPFQVYSFVAEVYPAINGYKYINVIWFSFNWLAMSNSCYNPFIYGLLNEKFKREYRLLFAKTNCMKKRPRDRNSASISGPFANSDDLNNENRRMTLTYRSNSNFILEKRQCNGQTAAKYTRFKIKEPNEETEETCQSHVGML